MSCGKCANLRLQENLLRWKPYVTLIERLYPGKEHICTWYTVRFTKICTISGTKTSTSVDQKINIATIKSIKSNISQCFPCSTQNWRALAKDIPDLKISRVYGVSHDNTIRHFTCTKLYWMTSQFLTTLLITHRCVYRITFFIYSITTWNVHTWCNHFTFLEKVNRYKLVVGPVRWLEPSQYRSRERQVQGFQENS